MQCVMRMPTNLKQRRELRVVAKPTSPLNAAPLRLTNYDLRQGMKQLFVIPPTCALMPAGLSGLVVIIVGLQRLCAPWKSKQY